jgi:hypothetical protein
MIKKAVMKIILWSVGLIFAVFVVEQVVEMIGDHPVAIDNCLDSGGRWDYKNTICER